MIEAYKIGVTLSLTNQVSGVLGLIARDFVRVDAEAARLKASLKEIKLLGMAGAVAGGLGFLGLGAIGAAVKPAEEYAHQLSLMNAAGMQHKEIAAATAAAWKTTGDVMSTNVNENLKAIRELRMVFGSAEEATRFLPQMQRISAVLGNVLGDEGRGKAGDVAFSAAKALELRGASRDPEEFRKEADLMTKAVIASGGKVRPQDILQAVKYAGVAGTGFSNDFLYGIMPTLVQELGGSSTGTALTSMNRAIIGGVMPQRALGTWMDLGLVDPSKAIWTKTGSLKGIAPGGIKGGDLYQADPFKYVQDVLMPAMVAHGYTTQAQQQQLLERMFANRTASRIANLLATQGARLEKDFNLIGAAGTSGAYADMLKQDPREQMKALGEQWETLKTAFGVEVLPVLIPALRELVGALHSAVEWARDNPTLTTALVGTAGGLSALAAVGGTIMLASAGLRGLALVFGMPGIGAIGKVVTSVMGLGGAATAATAALGPLAALLGIIGALKLASDYDKAHKGEVIPGMGWAHGLGDKLGRDPDGSAHNWKLGDAAGAGWDWLKNHKHAIAPGIFTTPDQAPTAAPQPVVINLHQTTNLDGRPIAQSTAHYLMDDISRPPTSPAGFDSRANLPPVMLPAAP